MVKNFYDFFINKDVQYMDIDYMIGFRILTIDKENFNGLSSYQKELENMGIKLVLIQVNIR